MDRLLPRCWLTGKSEDEAARYEHCSSNMSNAGSKCLMVGSSCPASTDAQQTARPRIPRRAVFARWTKAKAKARQKDQ